MDQFSFGQFHYDPAQKLLFKDDVPVTIGVRAAALLHLLLSRRGEVVSKDDLIEAAWPGLAIEESNLSVQVAALRKTLGQSPAGGEWIVTVQRIGYRFPGPANPYASQRAPRAFGIPTVAILPFAAFGLTGEGHRRFADGLIDDLTTSLARYRSLSVLSRSMSFARDGRAGDIRAVARALGADYVVEGSLRQQADGQLKLNLQLTDGVTGAHVWARLFASRTDEELDALAGVVSAALEAQVHLAEVGRSRRQRPDSVAAYDFYLRGRTSILSSRQADNTTGVGWYLKALELEPSNPLFLGAAAEALHHRTSSGWADLGADDQRAARDLAHRALDQADPDAVSLGLIANALFTSREEDLAASISQRALALNGDSPLVLVCAALIEKWLGQVDDSDRHYRRAITLSEGDPTQRFALGGASWISFLQGRPEESLSLALRAAAIAPALSVANWSIIASEQLLGRHDRAQRALRRYMEFAPGVSLHAIDRAQPYANRDHLKLLLHGLRAAGLPER